MYNLFFYHIYRTSKVRRGDSLFDGALITTILLTMHGYILVSIVEVAFYLLFNISLHLITSTGGILIPIIAYGLLLLATYMYYRKNIQHIIRTYEERYAGVSHWTTFGYCVLFLFGSIALTVLSILLARSVQGLTLYQ